MMRLPTMRTDPIEMISSVRTFKPVVSQSSDTHSLAGAGSNKKRNALQLDKFAAVRR